MLPDTVYYIIIYELKLFVGLPLRLLNTAFNF